MRSGAEARVAGSRALEPPLPDVDGDWPGHASDVFDKGGGRRVVGIIRYRCGQRAGHVADGKADIVEKGENLVQNRHIISIVLFILAVVLFLVIGLGWTGWVGWLIGALVGAAFAVAGLVFYRRGK